MISSDKINKFLEYLNSNNSLDNSTYLTDCLFHMFIREADISFFYTSSKENTIKENIVVTKYIRLCDAFRRYYRNIKNVR